MSAKPFLDTNVILYLMSSDTNKADRAEALLAEGGTISVQVLNEAANVMIRKLKMDLDEVRSVLAGVRHFCGIEPLTVEIHDQALDIRRRCGFSVYDSSIVAAAARAGCAILYSEDLHDGQTIDGLTITNPFGGRR
ncbi:PIN domain-containing protein [Microvirga brassicacearum]|uniref:PIN domain-containing protein n=1 Tax=Microvirga brassicacearum TaxID=2580413 RepID=A0A5N3PDM9_9HYPH|nr:PIN domain-containing protein [Microvirga brassicacearum]KAB0267857.1 PIN domain-containing protein [Microvirga brassicacearum]